MGSFMYCVFGFVCRCSQFFQLKIEAVILLWCLFFALLMIGRHVRNTAL